MKAGCVTSTPFSAKGTEDRGKGMMPVTKRRAAWRVSVCRQKETEESTTRRSFCSGDGGGGG